MVKRMLIAALMVALLLSCAAGLADGPILAPTLDVPDLSGTADWPIFRGLQWSMDENVVLLLEQARGVELTAFGDASATRRYRSSAPVEVLGYEADVLQYEFSDDMGLCNITVSIQVEGGEAECDAVLKALSASITDALGEPLEANELAEGWSAEGDGMQHAVANWSRSRDSIRGADSGAQYAIGGVNMFAIVNGGAFKVYIQLSGGAYIWP